MLKSCQALHKGMGMVGGGGGIMVGARRQAVGPTEVELGVCEAEQAWSGAMIDGESAVWSKAVIGEVGADAGVHIGVGTGIGAGWEGSMYPGYRIQNYNVVTLNIMFLNTLTLYFLKPNNLHSNDLEGIIKTSVIRCELFTGQAVLLDHQ
ncbi:hypothetical protein E2C01_024301 [Portunus trituberculatus]|uniref:Uncharacterized protein n=1 Tax=Portunus trituberculatus TaxID=210409 RepID=A0A5B7ECT0_PORTR|nr:hypothetical protein [Portunus trituberculatus]